MQKVVMIKRSTGFPLLVTGVFLILFFSRVFQHGMFFDGLIYSCLSNNLADGIGSFWFPQFSETHLKNFHEHPPLAFGIESVFMQLFDGAFYTEKLYSFCMAVLTVLFIILIWRKLFQGKSLQHLYWLPVLFWIITPKNSWSFSNNMLENTMGMFSIACVYFLVLSIHQISFKKIGLIVLAAVLLLLSFLTKGFPGLFPLGLFFLYFIFIKENYSFKNFLRDSVLLFGLTGLVFFLLFYFNIEAWKSISAYLDIQFIDSLAGRDREGDRLGIMKNLFNELIPFFILTIIFFLAFRKKLVTQIKAQKRENKFALFFLAIGLSASVPLMISPKLSSFYLITALPYFAISFAFFLSVTIEGIVEKLKVSKIGTGITKSLAVVSIVVAIILTTINFGTIGRDKELLNDLEKISKIVAENSIISVDKGLYDDWTTMSYFQRYHRISFDTSGKLRSYHLTQKGGGIPENYSLVELGLEQYELIGVRD